MERKLNGIEEVGVVGGSDGKGFQSGWDEGADGGTRSVNGVRSEPEADRSGGAKSAPEMEPDGGAQSALETKRSGGVKSAPETEPGSEARNREHGGCADVKREKQKLPKGSVADSKSLLRSLLKNLRKSSGSARRRCTVRS